MHVKWLAHRDGFFDLRAGSLALEHCDPALDGQQVHPLRVTVKSGHARHTIVYERDGAVLTLQLDDRDGCARVACRLRGSPTAPHWIQPISQARVRGAMRFFRHGLGFSGPSGFVSLAHNAEYSYDSYLTSARVAASAASLSCAALAHQRFLHKTTLRNRSERSDFCNRRIITNQPLCECGFATEGIAVPRAGLTVPALYFYAAPSPWRALRSMAERIAQAVPARPPQPPRYHYCSWYQRARFISEEDLNNLLRGLQQLTPPVPIQAIQIDDGYQRCCDDWLEWHPRWPNGLPAAIARICEHGYQAGIWIAPFMVGNRSRLCQEHPEWLLRDAHGRIIVKGRNYVGTHENEETYILDTSHPGAFAYLRHVFRTLRSFGITLVKTDCMDWGLKDSLHVRRHTPGKTSVEYFVDVLRMIREEIGDESHWLACISPYAPFIGFADSMRVANDVSVQWSRGGLGNMLDETYWCQDFNNLYWQNDPDVVRVRHYFTHLSDAETVTLARWNGLLGGSIATFDDFATLTPERLALWRFVQPGRRRVSATLPGWSGAQRLRIAVRPLPGRAAAMLEINPHDEPITEQCALRDMTGASAAYVAHWLPAPAARLGRMTTLTVPLAPHACRLFYVSANPAMPPSRLNPPSPRSL